MIWSLICKQVMRPIRRLAGLRINQHYYPIKKTSDLRWGFCYIAFSMPCKVILLTLLARPDKSTHFFKGLFNFL